MKPKSTFKWLFAAALVALAVACGKSGGGGGEPAPVVPAVVPTVVPPNVRVGFFAQNSKMDQYYNNMGSSYVLQSGMYEVFKTAMRTCDRGTYNGGYASCQSFMSGFNDIMIYMNGSQANQVQMVVRTMPDTSCQSPYACSGYWYSLPSFEQFILGIFGFNTFNNSNIYNPMVLNMTVWPINNSQGFELRGYAPGMDLYYNSGGLLFQFQVPQGKFEDMAWNFQLVFNGKVAASGRMVRCSQPNCGVQGF